MIPMTFGRSGNRRVMRRAAAYSGVTLVRHMLTASSSAWWLMAVCAVSLMMAVCGPTMVRGASNTAGCDWTGSGLSTARANREVISIYLRCTAGRIVWNYPRGAIRVLLRRPSHLHENFRACLKIYPTPSVAPMPDTTVRRGRPPVSLSPQHRARIYLEAPRRLIALFGGGAETDDRLMASSSGGAGHQPLDGGHPYEGEVLVKCFRSVNGQVALYVEAEESQFANVQTIFKYNLEFINNKQYSLRPTNIAATTPTTATNTLLTAHNIDGIDDDDDGDDNRIGQPLQRQQQIQSRAHHHNRQITVTATPTPIDQNALGMGADTALHAKLPAAETWPNISKWWLRWSGVAASSDGDVTTTTMPQVSGSPPRLAIDEQIVGRLGETYEICRPCTDAETAHAFCSSEIVTRGTMFGVQQRPRLATNEIYVNRTHLLRNNLFDILADPIDLSGAASPAKAALSAAPVPPMLLSFHTPLHCATAHEPGEFVFMGRRRFEEMMVICAPRLDDWAATVARLQRSGETPCVLSS